MFKIYVVNGQRYNVSSEKEAKFLQEFPDAEILEETITTPSETVTQTVPTDNYALYNTEARTSEAMNRPMDDTSPNWQTINDGLQSATLKGDNTTVENDEGDAGVPIETPSHLSAEELYNRGLDAYYEAIGGPLGMGKITKYVMPQVAGFIGGAADVLDGLGERVPKALMKGIAGLVLPDELTDDEKERQALDTIVDVMYDAVPKVGLLGIGGDGKMAEIAEEAQRFTRKIEPGKDFQDKFAEGDYGEGVRMLTQDMASAIPSVLTAMTGIPGIVTLGGIAAADKFEQGYEALEGKDENWGHIYGASATAGLVESASAAITGSLKTITAGVANKLGVPAAKNVVAHYGTMYGVGSATEYTEESMAAWADKAIDKWMLGDENALDNVYKEMNRNGIIGALLAPLMIGGKSGGKNFSELTEAQKILVSSAIQPTRFTKKQAKKEKQILDNSLKLKTLKNNPQLYKIKKQQIENDYKELTRSRNEVSKQFEKMSSSELNQMGKISEELGQLSLYTSKKANTDVEYNTAKEQTKKLEEQAMLLFLNAGTQKETSKKDSPRSIKAKLIQQWKNANEDIKAQFLLKKITKKQYEADKKKNEMRLKDQLKKLNKELSKSNKLDEDISKSNVVASTKTQEAFEQNVKDGEITKDEKGKNIFTDKAVKAIKKLQENLINKVVNSKFGMVPDGMIVGDKRTAKRNFKANVEGEFFELLRDYDPSSKVPLAAWLQKRLPQRANRAFKGVTNQAYVQSLESNKVQGMLAEEDSAIDPEASNINTAEALNIGEKVMKNIRNAAKKALLTTKQSIDNIKFKRDIAKSLKDDLYNQIKKELNLKNTKKNKGLTKAIENNPVAFYESLSVESMRMARTKDGKNPFEEAGFLVRNKDGILEKKKYNPKIGVDFIYYFNDANLKPSTRSDRQMNLVEALATSMGAREAISLLETDLEFRKRFAEQQQKEKDRTIFQKAADKIQNVFQKITEKTSQEFAVYDKEWPAFLAEMGVENINLNDETQRKAFLEKLVTTGLTKLLPASFFRNFQGTSDPKIFYYQENGLKYVKNLDGKLLLKSKYDSFSKEDKKKKGFGKIERQHARNVFFINTAEADAWIKEVGVENFAKEKDIYKAISKTKDSYVKTVNKKKEGIDINDPAFVKDQDNKLTALEDIFTIFQDYMIEDGKLNKEKASIVAGLLTSSSSWQEHFVRKLSPIKFTTSEKMFDSNGKRLFTEEHTLPASAVAKYLFKQATEGTVKDNFNLIKNNYFQGALLDVYDNKLSGIGPDGKPFNYKNKPPDGWELTDNIWARYFNINVNNNNGGIDPNTIILRNGKSVAQEFNVKPDGTITPDIKQLQQESIAEQTEDQVENLIDRAIAKLTELTGSKGTLQMNLATIPVQTIISALRTVKLAYQGGKLLAQAIDMGYNKIKDYMSAQEWADFVSKSTQEVRNQKNPADVKLAILSERGVAQMQEQSRKEDEKLLKEFGIEFEGLSTDQIVEKLGILRKAKSEASNTKNPTKKARVFDFDDTLAKTQSNVLYKLPDGTEGSLNATQFAEQYNSLKEAGATFDYSEFNQVKKGSKGPLANLAKRFTEAVGDRDVFVLTARPAEAAAAIQEFLRSTLGISIPLKNITGLENGTPGAKAMWIAEKVSQGYNDIFFADDSKSNVDAVEKMLTDLGVTKRVQQAKDDGEKTLEDEMDSLVRTNKPSKLGRILNKLNIYIPPGADDFAGLLSYFVGSGKKGEQQQKWFKDNLLDPFAKGISAWTSAKVSLAKDYKELKKRFKNKRLLAKKVLGGLYTNEQAVRAYLYNKAGQELGLNKADTQDLIALVEGNSELKAFADELSKITKLENGYPNITKEWLGGNIDTDIANAANVALRNMFLQDFVNNKNQIFSDQNLKLIKEAYGNDFTNALENILERMTTGINRKKGKDKEFNTVMNWINQSVGAVMALNMRSAILQQLSIVNYTNWSFNNPFMMAKAMANVPQFLQDYIKIWNSPFLQERRGRMSIEVNMEDIADSNPGNLFLRMNKKLLELGFKPTQWGDSNAISFGGATWYRNRLNQLLKQGIPEKEAEEQTMREFRELSEEHQQSSRPDRISRQQSSDIGRLILAFANTPLQLARSTKKAVGDLIYRRGDPKTNASKILYYGMAQSVIFGGLQQGLFSLLNWDGEDDDEELNEKEKKKLEYALHSTIDGLLRGMGFAGATTSALKNLAMEYLSQQEKRKAGEYVRDGSLKLIQKGLSISPPISKKIGDIVEAQKFETWRQYKNDPFYQAFAVANYISGLTNVPVDRVFKKIENLKAATDDRTEAWQSVFLSLGWSPYNVGVQWPEMPAESTSTSNSDAYRKRRKYMLSTMSTAEKKAFYSQERRNKYAKMTDEQKLAYRKKRIANGQPLFKKEKKVKILGKAYNDGTIKIAPGLSPEKEKKVRAHEERHLLDMKEGRLGYNKNSVYWNGKTYARTPDKKIVFQGKKYIEGHPKLPWEIVANQAERRVS